MNFNKLIVAPCFVFTLSAFAQNKAEKFDSLFSKLYADKKFTGNILIAENGKPVFKKSYGQAFREKNLDLNDETVFELASVSKQFTAMGIMLLKKQDKLDYKDSLGKFFPELPYHNITVRHLLNHTSGLPDYIQMAEESWNEKKIMTNKDMIALMAEKKPAIVFLPGEQWEYSNTGYALLGSIIEKASGQSFGDYLSAHIFKPLGMNRTRVFRKRFEQATIDNYAYGYLKDSTGTFVMADSFPGTAKMVYTMDGIYGDGVVNSTTGDLLKWDQALYTDKLVSKEIMKEAFTHAPLTNGKTFNYGFGWLLADSPDFGPYMFHSGGWPGYSTWMERHPRDNKTIILLANSGSAAGQIKATRNILYGTITKTPVAIKLDEKILKQYEGFYLITPKDSLHVWVENGNLVAEGAGQKKHKMFPETPDMFFRKDADYKMRFKKDAAGFVVAMEVLREGPTIEALKLK